jgi:hypothetical protein
LIVEPVVHDIAGYTSDVKAGAGRIVEAPVRAHQIRRRNDYVHVLSGHEADVVVLVLENQAHARSDGGGAGCSISAMGCLAW